MCDNALLLTDSLDPWHNLALEELLFDAHEAGVCLYLWRNQNTVVIGRNQNAWKECRMAELERDGGKLARRTSGGGAVFHDVGNLNFTFITTKPLYDQTRQLKVILSAVRALGIEADFTGRNDLVTGGAKFSGNAFRHSAQTDMHHGTLLLDVDMDKLGKYLAPSKEKLQAKGVESVRARVCNLSASRPGLTVEIMREAVIEAFFQEYGPYRVLHERDLDAQALQALQARHESWDWRCGASPRFDMALSRRFDWGELELHLRFKGGYIQEARAYSDAMDEAFIQTLPAALTGVRFTGAALSAAVGTLQNEMAADIAAWLLEKIE